MLKNSYQHPLLSAMDPDRIRKSVQVAILDQETIPYEGVVQITTAASDVPEFAHPLSLPGGGVAIDVRTVTKLDKEGRLITRSAEEYEFQLLRARLEVAWVDEERQVGFTTLSQIAGRFYSAYIAEVISRMYTLRADRQSVTHIVAAYYHWCQYRPIIEDMEEHEASHLKYIRIVTGLPVEFIKPVLQEIYSIHKASINSTYEFLQLLEQLTLMQGTLPGLDKRTLNQTIMYNWRGGHANEIVMLSLDYPPCFIAMLLAANQWRAYKSTPLESLIKRNRKVDLDQYAKTVKSLIQD